MPRWLLSLTVIAALALTGCISENTGTAPPVEVPNLDHGEHATFAGGCFWCVERDFDHVPGVLSTTSGYTGGKTADPTYRTVTRGSTGHREAVRVIYDPQIVSFAELVEIFWRSIDPTDAGGQFCDRGHSYASAIFVHDDAQRQAAESSKQALIDAMTLAEPIVTTIEDAGPFYPAEAYHQDYYQKNPGRYGFYRSACGRDRRIETLWGDQAHRGIDL